MAEVIEAFTSLNTRRERVAILHAILEDLDSYEVRLVTSRLQERAFHYDIIGSTETPFEILLAIFAYLDPVTPFRLQRVSKRWQQVLSSPQLLDASLSLWYSKRDHPLAGEILGQTPDEIRKLKLEHIGRFRRGEPSSTGRIRLTVDEDGFNPNNAARGVCLHRDYLAYHYLRTAYLVHLPSGEMYRFGYQNRQSIDKVYLNDNFLIFAGFNSQICAVNLETKSVQCCRISGISWNTEIYGSGKTIWFLGAPPPRVRLKGPTPLREEIPFVKWDLEDGSCREVRVTADNPDKFIPKHVIPGWCAGFIREKDERPTAFLTWWRRLHWQTLEYSDTCARVEERTELDTTRYVEFTEDDTWHDLPLLRKISYDGCYQLPLRPARGGHFIGFNANQGSVMLLNSMSGIHQTLPRKPMSAPLHADYDESCPYPSYESGAQFWKDTRYWFDKAADQLCVESPQIKRVRKVNSEIFMREDPDIWPQYSMLSNDRFILCYTEESMIVLSFDPDVKIAETEHVKFTSKVRLV